LIFVQKDVTVKSYFIKSMSLVVVPQLYKCDLKELARCIVRQPMPESAKTDITKLKPTKAVKEIRTVFPDRAKQEEMRDEEQNSEIWCVNRKTQWGGSGHDALDGYNSYSDDNRTVWLLESGRISKQPPRTYDGQLPLDSGHWHEPEAAEVYRVVMGVKFYNVGMVLHPKYPFVHVSPDGMVEFFDGVYHNKYTIKDARRLLCEIKNPLWKLYCTKSGRRALVPAHYLVQLYSQMDTFLVDAVDFICHYRCRADDPKARPYPEKDAEGSFTGRFICAESLITRVYRNTKGAAKVLQLLNIHRQHLKKEDVFIDYVIGETDYVVRKPLVNEEIWLYFCFSVIEPTEESEEEAGEFTPEEEETIEAMRSKKRVDLDYNVVKFEDEEFELIREEKQVTIRLNLNDDHKPLFENPNFKVTIVALYPPKLTHHEPFPDVIMVPLKWLKFYIVPPKGHMLPVDLKTNELIGEITAEVEHYWDAKPLKVTMAACHSGEDLAVELPCVPPPEPTLTAKEVVNPVLKEEMAKYPDLSVQDVIWNFMLEKIKAKEQLKNVEKEEKKVQQPETKKEPVKRKETVAELPAKVKRVK
jgi:hypothetical protein